MPTKATNQVVDLSKVEEIIDRTVGDNPYELMLPIVQAVQEEYGYVPEAATDLIAGKLGIPVSKFYGIITFYSDIRLEPTGAIQIQVCDGSSCHVLGAEAIRKAVERKLGIAIDETTPDGRFTLIPADYCIGACDLGPLVKINDTFYGKVTVGQIQAIIDGLRENRNEGEQ
ncbi:MAG: NAD(P)H-dependent oxidoreductase subunit E [Chloroflexi bacterium]|nr:NAD(P)H-dependent oxidoreductase subunit E [Chloroflexota bacterium]